METEILGIIPGAALPIYPILYVIHQRTGRYEEVVEEFKKAPGGTRAHKGGALWNLNQHRSQP